MLLIPQACHGFLPPYPCLYLPRYLLGVCLQPRQYLPLSLTSRPGAVYFSLLEYLSSSYCLSLEGTFNTRLPASHKRIRERTREDLPWKDFPNRKQKLALNEKIYGSWSPSPCMACKTRGAGFRVRGSFISGSHLLFFFSVPQPFDVEASRPFLSWLHSLPLSGGVFASQRLP